MLFLSTLPAFNTLRARGAFLVSGEVKAGKILPVTIVSEQGEECVIVNPWKDCEVMVVSEEKQLSLSGEIIRFQNS